MQELLIILGGAIAIWWIALALRRRVPRIQSPVLGILDLSAGSATAEVDADRAALGPLFSALLESTTEPPRCNVLFLYCHIEADGSLRGHGQGLREIIRDSGAAVVVVAMENEAEAYVAAAKDRGYGRANLVMTLHRKGEVFATFFQKLFSLMKGGVSMPVAWVRLAPQVPGMEHTGVPDTVFACEAGQVAFQ
jgi:hypothetical protein